MAAKKEKRNSVWVIEVRIAGDHRWNIYGDVFAQRVGIDLRGMARDWNDSSRGRKFRVTRYEATR